MKLLVDMLACQTFSRFRGIGRYTLSLTLEMAKQRGLNEMITLADPLYAEPFEELRQEFIRLLPSGAFLPYYHNSLENAPWLTPDPYSRIAESLIEQAYQVVAPDVVLTPSLFEGWGGGTYGKVPLPDKRYPNQKRAVILYDIIPYIFKKQYLDPDPRLKNWYLERIDMLQHYDLLLAISEATRQDAINVLGLSPDNVVNISGAASAIFKKVEMSEKQRQQYLTRFGISRPFILYIGGNDFRKNMDGALRIFAQLPREITSSHQLVLNDVGDETAFRKKAHQLGLDDTDLVIFRRVTDEEIVALYNLTKLLIFPSLYEGFGLPVLEAMSCGAPVLASNNSSLPEVVGNTGALFNVADEPAAAASILKILTDDDFRLELSQLGLEQAKNFSWAHSAKRAWDAIEDLGELDSQKKFSITPNKKTGMKIAYVSPLPPQQSGIADYSAILLPYLAKYFDIDLFTQPELQVSDKNLDNNFSIFSWDDLKERHDEYDMLLYHMGNSELHIPMLDMLQKMPGVIVSHDFFMSNLPFVKEIRTGQPGIFFNEMGDSHGLRGLIDYIKQGREKSRWKWPLNWKVLKNARALIIHSKHPYELLKQYYAYGWKPNATIIKHFRETVPVVSPDQKLALRRELDLDPNAFIFCSFGFMAPTKLNNFTIEAFAQALPQLDAKAEFIFVGQLEGGEYGLETSDLIKKHKLNKKIRITDYVSMDDYEKYLACADVAIQLRTDSRGETSGALLDCLAFGLPTIINAHGTFDDYDPNSVIKLTSTPTVDQLAQAMITAGTDTPFRMEKSQRALNLILEHHEPTKIAQAYADVIIKAIETKEQKIFAPLVEAVFELGSPPDLLELLAGYAAKNTSLRCQPRILIDVTELDTAHLALDKKESVSQAISEMLSADDLALKIELVLFREGQWLHANQAAERLCELPDGSLGPDKPLIVQPGDVLVLFDAILPSGDNLPNIFELIRQKGGKVVTFVQRSSAESINTLAIQSDIFLCASRENAEMVKEAFELHRTERTQPVNVYYPREELTSIWEKSATWLLDTTDDQYFITAQQEPTAQNKRLVRAETDDGLGNNDSNIEENTTDIISDGKDELIINIDENYLKYFPISLGNGQFADLALPISSNDPVVNAYKRGEYINQYLVVWLNMFSKPGGNLLDLGCHVGTMSVPAAALGRNVLAVDASQVHVDLVRASAVQNHLTSLNVMRCAISEVNGYVIFEENGLWGAVTPNSSNDLSKLVPAKRVDSLLGSVGWKNIDLVKIDIEGSELAALKSMENFLVQPNAPVIFYESNGMTFDLFGYSISIIREYLENLGYKTYRFESGRLVYCPPNQLQPEGWLDVIALPAHWQDKMKKLIDNKWDRETFVQRCLEWGKSDHLNLRQYIAKEMKSYLDFPKDDQRLIQLAQDLAEEQVVSQEAEPDFVEEVPTTILSSEDKTIERANLKSCACSQEMLEADDFQKWIERMKGRRLWMHRKLWEQAYISQALHERGFLKQGMRGLGFAVGQEPLPALFASYGCEILATDLDTKAARGKGWVNTNQHIEELNKDQICPDDLFEQLVSFRFVDMNQIDEDLQGFDFLWSSCSLEHLGSLEHGKQFIYNAMKCLKPGGFAIHTTEFNISSNEETIEEGPSVIYSKKDIEEIARTLHAGGHSIELDFTLGQKPFDLHVDIPPYKQDVHLRLELGGYTSTSYGLIIQKQQERK